MMRGIPIGWMTSPLPENHPLSGLVTQRLRYFAEQSWVWDGVRFDMLYPTWESCSAERLKDNDRSCVLKINSPYGSLLLTRDIERVSEMELLERYEAPLPADVLVVPHHGNKTSSPPAFCRQRSS